MINNATDNTLCDFIDLSSFQDLLESFSRLTGIATAILNLKGDVLIATGWRTICTEFHRKHQVTAKRCQESDTILAGQLAQGEYFNVYKCKNGLIDVAVPLKIENHHVGNLFIGQFLYNSPDLEFFNKQAEEFGFDQKMYIEALSTVPILSEEKARNAIKFLSSLTDIIGKTGLANKMLFESNRNLELRVQERTTELTYSNERLRVLNEASFEGIVILENGVIVEANNTMLKIFGFNSGLELTGIKATNLVATEKRQETEANITSGCEEPYETLGVKKNGEIFPIEVRGKTFSFQGRLVRCTAVRDLTEKKEAEKEIQALRKMLPLCSFCKKIRDDQGYWEQVDTYIHKHSIADITHSICPECARKHYAKFLKSKD